MQNNTQFREMAILPIKVILLALLVISIGSWVNIANAVSLGQVQVKSKLGQSFKAIIPIKANSNDAAGLLVKLASGSEYEKLGVDYKHTIRNLKTKMIVDGDLKPTHVLVYSMVPMFDPEVRVIIDATWPEGRFLRSYVLLVEPSENIHTLAKSANKGVSLGGSGRRPGEVMVIREDEPSPYAPPLTQQYYANPPPPIRRAQAKRSTTTRKTKVSSKNSTAIANKRKELKAIQAQIKAIKSQLQKNK